MSFTFGVPFTPQLFLFLVYRFLALVLIAFLVGTINCLVFKFSTVSTESFECFLRPFFVRGTCKEGIIILLFFPALSLLHCLEYILQNLINFCDFYCTFSELVFYDNYGLISTMQVYLFCDKLLDSKFGFRNRFLKLSLVLTLSLVGCTSRVYSLFNWMFINVLKNLYSRLG